MKKRIQAPIKGLTCANCVRTVKNVINSKKGAYFIDVDLASELLTIEFSDDFDFKKVKKELDSIGYEIILKTMKFI